MRWAALVAATLALLALRIYAAHRIGFGDSEALYACYARHPQPVYLDHPGLIGVLARALGGGDAPSPFAAHLGTALLSTMAPWMGALAARAAGASWTGSAIAAGALMLAPEISVGLFGLTPDLLLIVCWYAAVLFAALALKAEPGSARSLLLGLASGFAAGLSCDAKVSGVLLVVGLGLAWASPAARMHRGTLVPWAGLVVALVVFSPVVVDEIERGFPMMRHRLVETQKGAGPSLRNLAVLAGGQLLYVTPPLVWAAVKVIRDLYARRNDDVVSALLWSVTVAALPLVLLACLSPVAEPHWIAPLYLALPLHFARGCDTVARAQARTALVSPITRNLAVGVGITSVALAHAWVLLPLAPRLLGAKYEPRYDLANDLYAWRTGLPMLRRAFAQSVDLDGPPPIVVGPHWTVCAQVHAALPASILVGCEGDIPDDFSRWLPRSTWEQAPVVLYVTDDRFGDPVRALPRRRLDAAWHVNVERGGVSVRRISISRLVVSASASVSAPPLRQ
jgi:Dolichyl-phosphate-mannose-protein mannosyltransferase